MEFAPATLLQPWKVIEKTLPSEDRGVLGIVLFGGIKCSFCD